jgi:hypothetical protein
VFVQYGGQARELAGVHRVCCRIVDDEWLVESNASRALVVKTNERQVRALDACDACIVIFVRVNTS